MQPDSSIHLSPIFNSFSLIVAVAAVLLALLALAPSFGAITAKRKRILAVLRAVVVIFVLVALLRPAWVTTEARRELGTLIVLVDRSRSMQVTDAAEGNSRWEALQEAFLRSLPELQKLRDEVEVKLYAFDESAQILSWEDKGVDFGDQADGGRRR